MIAKFLMNYSCDVISKGLNCTVSFIGALNGEWNNKRVKMEGYCGGENDDLVSSAVNFSKSQF